MVAVDEDLDAEPVAAQQNRVGIVRITRVAGQVGAGSEARSAAASMIHRKRSARHPVGDGVAVGAGRQWGVLMEQLAGTRDNAVPSHGVVRPVASRAAVAGDHVGAVQRVVQAAPAGVRGVQGVAGVVHGNHQLRSGHLGDLRVHVRRRDLHTVGFGSQVPDVAQERLVGVPVVRLASPCDVPLVDLGLQIVAGRQEGSGARIELADDGTELVPESIGVDPGTGRKLRANELRQGGGDLQPTDGDGYVFCHALTLGGTFAQSAGRAGARTESGHRARRRPTRTASLAARRLCKSAKNTINQKSYETYLPKVP